MFEKNKNWLEKKRTNWFSKCLMLSPMIESRGDFMVMAFLHGFILALGLILPLGVQNLFVLQQGILQPRLWKTVPAVVTAALCDTVLISCSVGGVAWLLAGT